MSEPAPKLFEARCRWAILQEMSPLSALFLDSPNTEFDELYIDIRDAIWEKASQLVREREPAGGPPLPVDPLKIDLADVRYLTYAFVSGFKVKGSMVDSPEGDGFP